MASVDDVHREFGNAAEAGQLLETRLGHHRVIHDVRVNYGSCAESGSANPNLPLARLLEGGDMDETKSDDRYIPEELAAYEKMQGRKAERLALLESLEKRLGCPGTSATCTRNLMSDRQLQPTSCACHFGGTGGRL